MLVGHGITDLEGGGPLNVPRGRPHRVSGLRAGVEDGGHGPDGLTGAPEPEGGEGLEEGPGEVSQGLHRSDDILDSLRPVSEAGTGGGGGDDSHDPASLLPCPRGHTTLSLSPASPHHSVTTWPGYICNVNILNRVHSVNCNPVSSSAAQTNKQIFPSRFMSLISTLDLIQNSELTWIFSAEFIISRRIPMITLTSLYYYVMSDISLSEIQKKFNENTLICCLIY